MGIVSGGAVGAGLGASVGLIAGATSCGGYSERIGEIAVEKLIMGGAFTGFIIGGGAGAAGAKMEGKDAMFNEYEFKKKDDK